MQKLFNSWLEKPNVFELIPRFREINWYDHFFVQISNFFTKKSSVLSDNNNYWIVYWKKGSWALIGALTIKIEWGIKSIVLVELSPNIWYLLSSAHLYEIQFSLIFEWAGHCKNQLISEVDSIQQGECKYAKYLNHAYSFKSYAHFSL